MPAGPDEAVRRLAAACHPGDADAIEAALHPDAVAVSDSGAPAPAAAQAARGAAGVARLLRALLPGTDVTTESVNGRAGLVLRRAGVAVAVIAVSHDEARATALWIVRNPAKLRGWHRR
ncbi:nuclear transport factor 2 family protein [Micromonospora sp. PLK6-60]|uniref:nuclear transport factor 2 family protein n=1 Tax=Micromonospora sp. PLK6-60 TaxID=2873383 RepID=UPI001CA7701C|nr:nuclear transport factor 2 family protein [Micromonospora sp. PLK6-60]MBY8870702.1 nuclear transport factor 2 family protein [Micromonospora sp. PLK6-60]